ncbi:MAG TPA: protein phosphatase 2C domain-containing protein, partial [Clostridiales bacterium]|nr:protein phosphatase 2C domain-containing protein [Clostridiales bacterium]
MKLIAKTDRGLVRATNQDAYITGELSDDVVVAVVCDGMGGAKGGNIASSLAVKLIYEQVSAQFREDMQSKSIKNMLESVINAANAGVHNISRSNSELDGMGTTVVTAIIKRNT